MMNIIFYCIHFILATINDIVEYDKQEARYINLTLLILAIAIAIIGAIWFIFILVKPRLFYKLRHVKQNHNKKGNIINAILILFISTLLIITLMFIIKPLSQPIATNEVKIALESMSKKVVSIEVIGEKSKNFKTLMINDKEVLGEFSKAVHLGIPVKGTGHGMYKSINLKVITNTTEPVTFLVRYHKIKEKGILFTIIKVENNVTRYGVTFRNDKLGRIIANAIGMPVK